MKKIGLLVVVIFIMTLFLQCATVKNDESYQEIKNAFESLDVTECIALLSKDLEHERYIEARYRNERKVNEGRLTIHTPTKASADLYVNSYKYNRDLNRPLNDPREIYYLLNHIKSFNDSEIKIMPDPKNSRLFNALEDATKANSQLVMYYINGNVIESYTYEMEIDETSFNENNFTIIVKNGERIVAEIYSTKNNNKAKNMAINFGGRMNAKVIHLDRPAIWDLEKAFKNMMDGKDNYY